MKAQKVVVKIEVELLSIDALAGMLAMLARRIDDECESGHLRQQDGDQIVWETTREDVEF